MRLLVVGGAGYIGSVVAAHLVEAGHELTICDDLSTGNAWAVSPSARFVPAELSDRQSMDRVVADGYDAVLHLAGLSLAGASVRDPLRYLRSNLVGSLNLLEAMRAHGVRRLVYSSSAAVYGLAGYAPVEESAPLRPTSPYGAWKVAMEQAVGFEAAARSMGAVGLRCFSVAGARGALGEWHHPETHLVPLVLQVAAGVRPAVHLFGTDYATPDGTAVRDYVHVDDVARAHLLALDATGSPGHAIYNVGAGIGSSVREIVDLARVVTRRPIPVVEGPRRTGDTAWLVASPHRARDELGWTAVRPTVEVVADAWIWMRSRIRPGTAAASIVVGG